jgi:hypothetical protein
MESMWDFVLTLGHSREQDSAFYLRGLGPRRRASSDIRNYMSDRTGSQDHDGRNGSSMSSLSRERPFGRGLQSGESRPKRRVIGIPHFLADMVFFPILHEAFGYILLFS